MLRYFLEQLLTFKLWSNFLTPESIHGFRLTDRQQTAKLQNIESGIRPIRKYRIRSYTQFSYFSGALKISFCMSQNHVVVYAQSRLGRPPLHYVARHTNYLEFRPLVNPGQLGHFMQDESQREYRCLIFMLLLLFPENTFHALHIHNATNTKANTIQVK